MLPSPGLDFLDDFHRAESGAASIDVEVKILGSGVGPKWVWKPSVDIEDEPAMSREEVGRERRRGKSVGQAEERIGQARRRLISHQHHYELPDDSKRGNDDIPAPV
jgi:hypothetical protein